MDGKHYSTDPSKSRLTFSRNHYADYHTALLSQFRSDDNCNDVYTGAQKHPLIELQLLNQQQILDYNVHLIAAAVLQSRPFAPTEDFIYAIKLAAADKKVDPPLAKLWKEFIAAWKVYKSAQRKIYATIVATLRVGESMHYARSVPYGFGTKLLQNMMEDNRHNTTRALFALFSSLFTLKLKPGESFEVFTRRFDLITNRFANWDPPIVLPQQLLFFFVLRGLPSEQYGPITHIVLSSKHITLDSGLKMLRDVGQSEVGLINSTMGSTNTSSATANSVLAITNSPPPTNATTAAEKEAARLARRAAKMTPLCKKHGPCAHHGPKSLHATCECKDPTLSKRRARKGKQENVPNTNSATASPATPSPGPAPAQLQSQLYPAQPQFSYMHPQHGFPQPPYMPAPHYPPSVYHQPFAPFNGQPLNGQPTQHHMLTITCEPSAPSPADNVVVHVLVGTVRTPTNTTSTNCGANATANDSGSTTEDDPDLSPLQHDFPDISFDEAVQLVDSPPDNTNAVSQPSASALAIASSYAGCEWVEPPSASPTTSASASDAPAILQ